MEELINRMAVMQMSVWDIHYSAEQQAKMFVTIPDFFRLRPLLKETGSRIRIKERHGLPFWLDKLEKRKFFLL